MFPFLFHTVIVWYVLSCCIWTAARFPCQGQALGSLKPLPIPLRSSSDLAPISHRDPRYPTPPCMPLILVFIFAWFGLICCGVSADVSLFKPYFTKGRKGDMQRKEVFHSITFILKWLWCQENVHIALIFLICSSLRLPPQKNTNRNSLLPYLLIKSLCLQ